MAVAGGGALPNGEGEEEEEAAGGREKSEAGPTSRDGRSVSDPSMADIDMLLPGR